MSDLFLGALVSEGLKKLIAEAKKFKDFKPLSKDLVSTMERLIPLTEKIESLQKAQEPDVGDLKGLKETMERASDLIDKCRDASLFTRSLRTRDIEKVNKDMLKFCQIDIQLLLRSNQLQSMEASDNNFQTVNKKLDQLSVSAPVFRYLNCSVPKLDKVLVGLDWPLVELKKRLLDKTVVNLVVSALPGCGKTTLVTQLCHDQDIKKKFKHIFFIVVSRTPDFKRIVKDLVEHKGDQAPTFHNDTQAAIGLRKLLEELTGSGILLVLDEVWPGAESFLEKFPTDIPNLKILVTSPSDFLNFGYTYHLKPLEDEYAKALLVECASRPDHASPAQYEDLLQKILKRCNGLPLLIKVVGSSLKNRSLTQWQGQVISWSSIGSTVLDNPRDTVLKPTFDALDPNLKECFLDMGSFLEGQKIRARIIIDIWAELYGNVCIKEKEKVILCMKYLQDLAAHNLLDLVPLGKKEHEDGFYDEFLVTQHNILRDLAIHQSESEAILERKRLNLVLREDKFPDWCLIPSHPVISASLLSISTGDVFSSNWVEMDCPNVEALILNLSSSDYALPSFIAGMKKLKVLTITNHGVGPARLRKFSYLSSLPNLKRIRLEKVSVTLLDILQLQLVRLEKLSFLMCSFGESSDDKKEIDVSKALPSLQEIDIDYCYDLHELPYWISEAVSLETLSITNCNRLSVLPEAIGNLIKLQVLRLSSCINLSELPETTVRLSSLQFLDISNCLGLRKLPLEIGRLRELKKISMRKCWRCELPYSVRNLENLEVKCDEETAYMWERLKPKMRNLRVQEEETEHNLNLLQMF